MANKDGYHPVVAPNVIFELFNEPQGISSAQWHDPATGIIRLIRAQGANQLVIIGGTDYAAESRQRLQRGLCLTYLSVTFACILGLSVW